MNGKAILEKYNDQCGKIGDFMSLESIIDQEIEGAIQEASSDLAMTDKLFITEIMNDLHKHGFVGGKAKDLLQDWAKELRERSRTKIASSRLKRIFCEVVGRYNW